MPTRTFRAVMENGDTYDDPSEDVLLLLLEDVAAGDGTWVIVEKVVDASGQTYAQVLRLSDGLFQVERRRGSADTHEVASSRRLREAHELLTRWAFSL
ncbi:hypothetical protein GCM10023258_24020 [Terrabacter aeriphilus]|uniref:Uncharacterized protein n=1 Tax=Terrabacter aeriphilus TaxID=515662 RepID=A0ABP9JFA4_9MICO